MNKKERFQKKGVFVEAVVKRGIRGRHNEALKRTEEMTKVHTILTGGGEIG